MSGSRPLPLLTIGLVKRSLHRQVAAVNIQRQETNTVNIMCGGTFYRLSPDGARAPYQYAGARGIQTSAGNMNSSAGNGNSSEANEDDQSQKAKQSQKKEVDHKPPIKKQTLKQKTMAMLDEELRSKMEGLAGDGGASGVEYEDGKPVAMKRSVKENMFRYI